MTDGVLLRSALFVFPLAAVVVTYFHRRPSRRLLAGVLVALAWNAWTLLVVNLLAIHFGWWRFGAGSSSFMGVAIEPWIGWTILWGAFLPLAAADRSLGPTLVGALWLDLVAMPLLTPVVILQPGWLLGEAVALGVALAPGLLLCRWTATGSNLKGRAALQVIAAGAFLLWLVPNAAVTRTGGWGEVLALPTWRLSFAAQVLFVPVALGLRAVSEFVRNGRGTPIPYDPPARLVTSGPYSYVRNPMQVSIVLIFVVSAVALWNPWLLAAAVIAFAYGAGLAGWHEGIDLERRFGVAWNHYRRKTRNWIPRWRPSVDAESQLLVAYSCSTCSSVGRWLATRRPIGLRIDPAESAEDGGIRRITYLPASGPPVRGVAAVTRALDHIHLGWALAGWVLSIPPILQLAQVISDVVGPGPQAVCDLPYDRRALSRN